MVVGFGNELKELEESGCKCVVADTLKVLTDVDIETDSSTCKLVSHGSQWSLTPEYESHVPVFD